jgi:hypothetical protein
MKDNVRMKVKRAIHYKLQEVANDKNTINTLSPSSNTDLGLMGALVIIQEIQKKSV